MAVAPLPPPAPGPWPGLFTPPAELLEWLSTLRPEDKKGKKVVLTLRWLVHAELERSVPEPAQSISHPIPGPPHEK